MLALAQDAAEIIDLDDSQPIADGKQEYVEPCAWLGNTPPFPARLR